MNGYALWSTLTPILACGLAALCWFFIRKRQQHVPAASQPQENGTRLDLIIVLLCFISIFLLPIRFRSLYADRIVKHYGNFNVLVFVA